MDKKKTSNSIVVLLLAASLGFASAMPYYFFHQEPTKSPVEPMAQKASQAAESVKESLEADQQQQGSHLPEKIVNHLSQFYEHGRKAMKGVYDNVSPDLKDIGGDLSEVAQISGETVKTHVAPLKENVKPYFDQAQKAVAPYVGKAKEEVPKLIEQAGPVISKGFSDLIGKIKTVGGNQAGNDMQEVFQDVQKAANGAMEQVGLKSHFPQQQNQQLSTNNIQHAAQEAGQKVTDMAQQVGQKN